MLKNIFMAQLGFELTTSATPPSTALSVIYIYIFDIDSLAVFLNHLYLIHSDSGLRKRTCYLFLCHRIFHGFHGHGKAEFIDDYFDRTDYCNQG